MLFKSMKTKWTGKKKKTIWLFTKTRTVTAWFCPFLLPFLNNGEDNKVEKKRGKDNNGYYTNKGNVMTLFILDKNLHFNSVTWNYLRFIFVHYIFFINLFNFSIFTYFDLIH